VSRSWKLSSRERKNNYARECIMQILQRAFTRGFCASGVSVVKCMNFHPGRTTLRMLNVRDYAYAAWPCLVAYLFSMRPSWLLCGIEFPSAVFPQRCVHKCLICVSTVCTNFPVFSFYFSPFSERLWRLVSPANRCAQRPVAGQKGYIRRQVSESAAN